MATIKDVAKHSGVSISLVSKALNGYTDIKPETKQRILNSVNELGYVPNANASSLSKKNKSKIAIIMRSFKHANDEYFIDEIGYIYATTAYKQCLYLNLDVIVIYDDALKGKSTNEITNYLNSYNINGIILFGISQDDDEIFSIYRNNQFKKVILDIPLVNETTSSVSIDDVAAQTLLLENVLNHNANKILYLAGPTNNILAIQRKLAAVAYCKDHAITIDIVTCNFDIRKSYAAVKNINDNDYDYIIAANDLMAIGAAKAIKENNFKTKIAGFDGIKALNIVDYHIPTIEQNFESKAKLAVDEIVSLLHGGETKQIFTEYKYNPRLLSEL